MSKTYREKLLDPRWQKKRLTILERDDFSCQTCGDNTNTLHVHHKNYYHGKEPWECSDNNLITLCETCHSEEEHYKTLFNDLIHDLLLQGKNYKRIYNEVNQLYDFFLPKLYRDFIEAVENQKNG